MTSVTFPTNIGGDGSTVSDDDNASTGLRNGGWRTRFVPCFTNQVAIATTLTDRLLTLSDTSASSVAIGLGAKSFTTAKFYNFAVGQFVVIASTASPTNYMFGQVTAYNSGTGALSVTVTITAGSGTIASWTISVASPAKVTTGSALLKGDGSGGFASASAGTDYVAPGGALGTPSSGTLTNCTFPTLNQNTTGTASNITAYTINQNLGTANSPSFSRVLIGNGSASSPSLAFSSDGAQDTGLYWGGDGYTYFTNNASKSGEIQPGGNLVMIGNVTAYSDARLKTDIEKIPDALKKVNALNGYTFNRIDQEGPRQTGVIAQEVLEVLPEAVIATEEHLSVAYGNMVGLLIEAVKELSQELADLKAKIGEK